MMSDLEKKEERNKRIGWITSISIQVVLLALFYFLVAWKAPNPPIPEYGIELGFTTSAGAVSSTPPPEVVDTQETEEEIVEQTQQELVEEPVETETPEPVVEEVEPVEEEVIAEEIDSPIPVEKKETQPSETKPVENVEEEVIEEKKVQEKPTEKPPVEEVDTGEGEGEEETEEPVIDQRAIYGSQGKTEGSNEGASLSLAGWVWDFKPTPDDTSDQTGKIVYKIVVDGDGYLVKIEVVSSTVSPAVEREYRQSVEKLTFSKTVDYQAAPLSTGTISFIIKSK